MQKRKIIILANGEVEDIGPYKKYLTDKPYIICANGDLKLAQKLGVRPNLVIGDFDSVDKKTLNKFKESKIKLKKFSKEKNKSDLHLALDEATSRKPSEIIIIGALGGRIDQTLTNIFLLLRALKKITALA